MLRSTICIKTTIGITLQQSRLRSTKSRYLEGGELFDKIKEMNHFTEKMAAEYIKQILSAVSYCHAKKIAHRDLKPENIMLASKNDSSQLKVIDFGTSRSYKPNIKMNEKIGSVFQWKLKLALLRGTRSPERSLQ